MKAIIPRYGFPLTIVSDNGRTFISNIVQKVARLLHITWKLHTAYQLQSSVKVEGMNQTLKATLAKFQQRLDCLRLTCCCWHYLELGMSLTLHAAPHIS